MVFIEKQVDFLLNLNNQNIPFSFKLSNAKNTPFSVKFMSFLSTQRILYSDSNSVWKLIGVTLLTCRKPITERFRKFLNIIHINRLRSQLQSKMNMSNISETIIIEDFENGILEVIEWNEVKSVIMIGSVILLWILGCTGKISHLWYIKTFTPSHWPMRILIVKDQVSLKLQFSYL